MRVNVLRSLAAVVAALALILVGMPANANPGPPGPTPRVGPNTDLVMTGTGPGQGVSGGDRTDRHQLRPAGRLSGAIPGGFETLNEGFAGIILAQAVPSGDTLTMYCIDIRTLPIRVSDMSTAPGTPPTCLTSATSPTAERLLPDHRSPAARAERQRSAPPRCRRRSGSSPTSTCSRRQTRSVPFTAGIVADATRARPAAGAAAARPEDRPDDPSRAGRRPARPVTVAPPTPAQSVTVTATGATMYSDAAGTTPIATRRHRPVGPTDMAASRPAPGRHCHSVRDRASPPCPPATSTSTTSNTDGCQRRPATHPCRNRRRSS